jgi:hypothetical protein
MDSPSWLERPRKRRAVNACVTCRTSKVRCDGKLPCAPCDKNDVSCVYHDAVKDENVLRIEKLEASLTALQDEMNSINHRCNVTRAGPAITSGLSDHARPGGTAPCAVDVGLITQDQAVLWYERYLVSRFPYIYSAKHPIVSFQVA